MIEKFVFVEAVAEGLWQIITGVDEKGLKAHQAWLALPEAKKQSWRKRAKVAIEDWQRETASPDRQPTIGSRAAWDSL